MKRVMVVTGIRSEYFLARSILQAIVDHPDLELQLVVSGAHLSPLHGYTVRDIEKDGFRILERIESLLYSDRDAARLKGAALQLSVLAHVVDKYRPDWLLSIADREEAMTVALCGAYLNIPVAHYAAGDRVVGNVDDMVRHAVSRLSNVMFTLSEESRERLIRAGEEAWRVHFVGHSGVDRFRTTPSMSADDLAGALGVEAIPPRYAVIVQHSISSEIEHAAQHMDITLNAVEEAGLPAFVSFPNSDPGHEEIIATIERHRDPERLFVFRNVPDREFINLLRGASMLIGNSSAGLMETPYLKLPVINVGRRQCQRTHAENVFFVPNDKAAIVKQILDILEDPATRERVRNTRNLFGNGDAGERVADFLAKIEIDERLLNKDLAY